MSFNFMAAVTIHSDFGTQGRKTAHYFHFFPLLFAICSVVMVPDVMILVFWMLSFKPVFSLCSFTRLETLFHSSLLSAILVVSPAYLRLLIFPLPTLTLVCDSSSLEFWIMYFADKLNKWDDCIQPCCIPFLILNQSVVPCPVIALWFDLCTDLSGDR